MDTTQTYLRPTPAHAGKDKWWIPSNTCNRPPPTHTQRIEFDIKTNTQSTWQHKIQFYSQKSHKDLKKKEVPIIPL